MLKPLLPMFRTDLSVCLKDIAEKKTGPLGAEADSRPNGFPRPHIAIHRNNCICGCYVMKLFEPLIKPSCTKNTKFVN